MTVLIWGVSGCGKTEVGRTLARLSSAVFVDADDLHPPESIAKMARGEPLDDADRAPWLARAAAQLACWRDERRAGVMACSALRRAYRDTLRAADPDLRAVLLRITPDLARGRLSRRTGHFMPVALVDSQFATLERPAPDERCLIIESTGGIDHDARRIDALLRGLSPASGHGQ